MADEKLHEMRDKKISRRTGPNLIILLLIRQIQYESSSMKMVNNIFLLMLLSSLAISAAHADATFYLVRHAEKQNDGTKDPHLTEQGHLRAESLAQQLSLAKVSKIYSTNYHRTQETAKPLSDVLGVSVEAYNSSNLEKFARALKTETGNVLIVGHSNTTPQLATLLSGQDVDAIDESEYENLYQVVLIGEKATLTRFKIFPIESTLLVAPKISDSTHSAVSPAFVTAEKQ